MPKHATVVLCDGAGVVLGELPPVVVPLPWWQEVGDVVDAVREAHGVEVTILRLLAASGPFPADGQATSEVTYLAELDWPPGRARLDPTHWQIRADPLRLTYASPGGPRDALAWARDALGDRTLTGARQERTWNLSAIWRLATSAGDAWLKVVPPFFAHEGAVIERLGDAPVPPLLAHAPGRVLLEHVPGELLWQAPAEVQRGLADALVGLQGRWFDDVDDLLALGVPDWRGAAFVTAAQRLPALARASDRPAITALVQDLPQRFEALVGCGLPDTLVHGDCHVGNALLGPEGGITILDWGDCGVGHPLLDLAALERGVAPHDRLAMRQHVLALWRTALPNADVDRAADLLAPVAELRNALVYDGFVRSIEATERLYHEHDAANALAAAARLAEAGREPA